MHFPKDAVVIHESNQVSLLLPPVTRSGRKLKDKRALRVDEPETPGVDLIEDPDDAELAEIAGYRQIGQDRERSLNGAPCAEQLTRCSSEDTPSEVACRIKPARLEAGCSVH